MSKPRYSNQEAAGQWPLVLITVTSDWGLELGNGGAAHTIGGALTNMIQRNLRAQREVILYRREDELVDPGNGPTGKLDRGRVEGQIWR